MHGTVDLGRRDAHAAISVEAHLERRPAEVTAMFIGDHSLPCRRWAFGALLFVELGHFERLLALPAQLPPSLGHSVVEILELNITEVRIVGDDLERM